MLESILPHLAMITLFLAVVGVVLGSLALALKLDTDRLADSAVTTAKLADGAVTEAKLADGALDHMERGDHRSKVYSLTVDGAIALRGNASDSIGLIATGFKVGHYVKSVTYEVETVTSATLTALDLGTGSATQCAALADGATAVTGTTYTSDTSAVLGASSHFATAANAFTATNNSVCLTATAVTATTSGKIHVHVEVAAFPGAPALPAAL